MRRIAPALAVLALAGLPQAARAQTWVEPAAPLNLTPSAGARNGIGVHSPSLAVIGGKLHAGWAEWDGVNHEARVARLEGNAWVDLGDACSPINASRNHDASGVALADDGGAPFAAWVERDRDGIGHVHAARYDAATGSWARPWGRVTTTPSGPDNGGSHGVQVVIVDGRPYVGWRQGNRSADFNRIARLTPGEDGFEVVGGPPVADSRGLDFATDGTELFATYRNTGWFEVARFTGSGWEDLPPPAPKELARDHGLAVRDGEPYVLVQYEGMSVRRYAGGAWSTVATFPAEAEDVVDMEFVGDALYVVTVDGGQVRVYRQAGGTFTQAGSSVADLGAADVKGMPVLEPALAAFDGRPWVAWVAPEDGGWKARVAGLLDEPPGDVPPRAGRPECAKPGWPGGGGVVATGDDEVAPAPPPIAAPPPAPPEGGAVAAPRPPRLVLLTRRARARGGRVRLRVRCAGEGRCRGLAIARARGRVVGRARVDVAAGRAATIVLRLTPRGRRMLRAGTLSYRLVLRPSS